MFNFTNHKRNAHQNFMAITFYTSHNISHKTNKTTKGTGDMAQRLRAPAPLPADYGSFPAPTWQIITICNSSPRDLTPSPGH